VQARAAARAAVGGPRFAGGRDPPSPPVPAPAAPGRAPRGHVAGHADGAGPLAYDNLVGNIDDEPVSSWSGQGHGQGWGQGVRKGFVPGLGPFPALFLT